MNPAPRLLAPLGLDAALARKAVSLAFASWLSFAVAALLHVHNAYWAAMPTWVIVQSTRGLVLERGVLRVLGTLIGAAAGFGIMKLPLPAVAQLALLSLWVALNAGLTHVLRGTHGYGALLAGMTAAVVVVPSVLAPTGSFELAAARVECTLIGVVVATVVLALLTPARPLADFFAEVRSAAADAVSHAAQALAGTVRAPDDAAVRRILARVSQLESSARLAVAASPEGYRRLHDVELAIVGALSLLAAAGEARGRRSAVDAKLIESLERIARHLRQPWSGPLPPETRRPVVVDDPAARRIAAALEQICDAEEGFFSPHAQQAPSEARRGRLAPHREWPLARRTAITAGLACLAASLIEITVPWPESGLVALGVCIFVSVLGSMPQPQLIAPKMLTGATIGLVFAVLYRALIQPHLDTPAELLASLAPFMLVGGFARVAPRTAIAAIDACMCFLLASQAGRPAVHDLERIFVEAGALLLAVLLVTTAFILRPRQPRRQAEEAAATIRDDLLRMLGEPRTDAAEWQARGARQILRLTLHLGREPSLGERWPGGLLAALNLGQAVIALQGLGMPAAVSESLRAFLRGEARIATTLTALGDAASGAAGRQAEAIRTLAAELAHAGPLLDFGRGPA
jgi:uncharacterized membrane protein YccC